MIRYWDLDSNLYDGKTLRQLNPHHLKMGDLVLAPDGNIGRLQKLGFKWGALEESQYELVDLRPASCSH